MRSNRGALALIPLDARPCTRAFPVAVGRIAGVDVRVPPPDLLGDLVRPAPVEDLLDWLEGQAGEVDAAVVALDTLVYGGLIPARRSDEPIDTLLGRLARVRELPIPDLYAFCVTMRISDSNVAEEEKSYWAEFGKLIHRWSFSADRYDRTRDPEAAAAAQAARSRIPDAIAEDYLATRRRNYAINLKELELAEQGRFRILCVTQDDTSPYGFNQAEKRQIEGRGIENVLVYPGADEVAAVLVARYVNERAGRVPVFRLQVLPPAGAEVVAMYEDRPLRATAAGQVRAVGGFLVAEGAGPDSAVDLVLNAPAGGQGDLALRVDLDRPDTPARDLAALAARLAAEPPPAFADVAYANGADPALWDRFAASVDPARLAAFAAWNTAGNTIGTVVAAAAAQLADEVDRAAQRQFILDRLADDYLYQVVLRPRLQAEGRPPAQVAPELASRLEVLWRERFPHLPIGGIAASFPWSRYFEADVRVLPGS
ncbi:MAG: DUF4127 family protein [Candidatus Sericytochromatia bacterium]|nr:DUF4127 family protein [Candidatus Tanganyikabacteria bacterium]